MSIEDGADRQESDKDGLTSLELEVGPNEAIIAMTIYLTKDENLVPLSDILRSLNRSGLSEDQAIKLLSDAKFRRVSLQKIGLTDRVSPVDDDDGEYWTRPVGKEGSSSWDFTKDGEKITLDEERITKLVRAHMLERPVIDFNLGGPPDKEALNSAPPYPSGYEGMIDPWLSDSPGTVSI